MNFSQSSLVSQDELKAFKNFFLKAFFAWAPEWPAKDGRLASRLFLLLLLCVMHWPVLALGSDHVTEQAYFRDPHETFVPEVSTSDEFSPYQGDLRLGYQAGAGWIRLKISPAAKAQAAEPMILRVSPFLLDSVELHEKIDGKWQRQLRGDLSPHRSNYCPEDAHCFALHTSTTEAKTVYLRVKNAGVMFVQTEVLSTPELTPSLVKRVGQRTVSLSMAVGLLMFGVLYLTINFSPLAMTYCVYQLFVALFVVSSVGMLWRLLPGWTAAHIDTAGNLLFVARVAMTVVLCWAVVVIYQTSRFFHLLVVGMLLICLVNMQIMLAGYTRLALQLNYAVFVLNPFVQILGLLSARKMDKRRRNILLACHALFILVTGIGSFHAFAGMLIDQRTDMFQHFGDWRLNGSLISAVFFWAVVSEQTARNESRSRELEQLRLEAEKVRAGQEKLNERGALIDMLTHELKNPLGTIKFALASLKRLAKPDADASLRVQRIDASVNRMDDLIHHVARSNKIELMPLPDHLDIIPAHEIVQDLIGDHDAKRVELFIAEGAEFRADRQLLFVILENLVGNAFKYAAPNSKIRIQITHERRPDRASETHFQISNQVQPGAEPDESRLFERYYRHSQFQNQPGMGIGLSLVRSAAKKLNSTVSYLAKNDQVTFTVRVPN